MGQRVMIAMTLMLDPDLLIIQGAHPQVEAWCRREQIPLLAWKTQSLAAWREEVRRYGELFACSDRVEEQLADWDRAFAAASAPATELRPDRATAPSSRTICWPSSFNGKTLAGC